MDVAHHSDRCSDVYHVALLHQQLLSLCAYRLDDRLGQQLLFGKSRNTLIKIYGSFTQKSATLSAGVCWVLATDVHGRPGMVIFVRLMCSMLHPRRAQGIESILVASKFLYRTIILGDTSGRRKQWLRRRRSEGWVEPRCRSRALNWPKLAKT